MKAQANFKHRDIRWVVGDLLYVKLRPYHQSSLARRANEKLAPRFYGPFKVLEKIGPIVYKLDLPDIARIHPVFHISHLKRVVGSHPVSPSIPSSLSANMEQIVQPTAIRPSPS